MTDELKDRDERLAALEKKVEDLQQQIQALLQEPNRSQPARRSPRARPPARERKERDSTAKPFLPKISISTEELLKWSGIGLVLISMGLLFKYSVDMGWLTPGVRVAMGFSAAIVLLGLGFRAHQKRPRFAQVLQGGGIATLYITLFASFQVLDVLPYETAFIGMVSTTAFALTLALWQDDAGLAVFGLLGGLATPFVLYTGRGDVAALVSYAGLLLTATTAIYLWRGWRSMLYTSAIGGCAVFLIAAGELGTPSPASFNDHLVVQLSAVFMLVAFWIAPVVRSVSLESGGEASMMPDREIAGSTGVFANLESLFRNVVHLLIVITPLVAAALTDEAWRLSDVMHGMTMIGLAALFGGMAAYLSTIDRDRLAYTHWLTVGILVTVGLMLILDGDALIVGLAIEVLILHVLASRLDDRWPLAGGHILAIFLVFWMGTRLEGSVRSPAIINLTALSDLVVIATGFAASFAIKASRVGLVYRAVSYIAALAWISRELAGFENGQAYVTAAWSVCGIALLVAGLTREDKNLRSAGLATLAVVVAKLFLVDLAELDPIWRIVAFLGVGAGFLLVGWFVPGLWGKGATSKQEAGSRSLE
ncbi:DUF2339 domain-containing protein [Bacteroidota bacterium]